MSLNKPFFLEEICKTESAEKILLCTHGLNQKPQALKPLLQDLKQWGFKSYLMHLPGHDGTENYHQLTSQNYFDSYKHAYDWIYQRHQRLPYFLGYSFGGLIGVHNYDQFPFEKMILLAPALQLHTYAMLLRPALPYLNKVKSISFGSSKFEELYRYHSQGVPRQVYQSFFSIYMDNLNKDKKYLQGSQGLVLTHPYDELISFKKLNRWVSENTNWTIKSINNHGAEFKRYNHLCFDQATLGVQSYRSLLQEIEGFLNETEKPQGIALNN